MSRTVYSRGLVAKLGSVSLLADTSAYLCYGAWLGTEDEVPAMIKTMLGKADFVISRRLSLLQNMSVVLRQDYTLKELEVE